MCQTRKKNKLFDTSIKLESNSIVCVSNHRHADVRERYDAMLLNSTQMMYAVLEILHGGWVPNSIEMIMPA